MAEKINGGDSYRDASFSYLRSETQKGNTITTTTRVSFGLERKKNDKEGEISVFGAERYFNTALDDDRDDHDQSDRDPRLPSRDHDHINRPGTPGGCSDVSSTSKSTAMLLKPSSGDVTRNPNRKHRKRKIIPGSKSFFATLGCTGTCTDEKSVHVDAGDNDADGVVVVSQPARRPDHHRLRYEARSTKRPEDHFAFPILSRPAPEPAPTPDPPRMSLEVFGSKPGTVLDEVAVNLERKLSVLTWDAIPAKPYGAARVSPRANRAGPGPEDMDSDASSDLFEIENITPGARAAGARRSGDYEPSEASIEWSVVTASAAAAADLGFDYDEKKLAANRRSQAGLVKPGPRRRPNSGLLGCNSQKSVSVAETTPQRRTSKEISNQ